MSLAVINPTPYSDTTLPLYPYETLPGTVMLVEPARSASFAGVPSAGAAVPDLAGRVAGAGALFQFSGLSAGNGLLERTSKGGIHAITSQASGTTAYAFVEPNDVVLQYLLSNISHHFYLSLWSLLTRTGPDGSEADFAISFSASPGPTDLLIAALQNASWLPSTGGSAITETSRSPATSLVSAATPVQAFAAGAVTGYTGTVALTATQTRTAKQAKMFSAGNSGAFGSTVTAGHKTSKIFYRAYIEDLTVSGRTFSQAQAVDFALYTKHVLTAGGRYFGDTYTNPSTLP